MGTGPRPSFIQDNMYFILIFSKEIGDLIFSPWISALACVYPKIPLQLQIVNVLLWFINYKYTLITNIPITCLWLALTGAIQATPYTNFMFLAIAKTDLYSDLDLKIKEREMVVNMLMIGRNLGHFIALYLRFFLL